MLLQEQHTGTLDGQLRSCTQTAVSGTDHDAIVGFFELLLGRSFSHILPSWDVSICEPYSVSIMQYLGEHTAADYTISI
jgi:hypothetical protein